MLFLCYQLNIEYASIIKKYPVLQCIYLFQAANGDRCVGSLGFSCRQTFCLGVQQFFLLGFQTTGWKYGDSCTLKPLLSNFHLTSSQNIFLLQQNYPEQFNASVCVCMVFFWFVCFLYLSQLNLFFFSEHPGTVLLSTSHSFFSLCTAGTSMVKYLKYAQVYRSVVSKNQKNCCDKLVFFFFLYFFSFLTLHLKKCMSCIHHLNIRRSSKTLKPPA